MSKRTMKDRTVANNSQGKDRTDFSMALGGSRNSLFKNLRKTEESTLIPSINRDCGTSSSSKRPIFNVQKIKKPKHLKESAFTKHS